MGEDAGHREGGGADGGWNVSVRAVMVRERLQGPSRGPQAPAMARLFLFLALTSAGVDRGHVPHPREVGVDVAQDDLDRLCGLGRVVLLEEVQIGLNREGGAERG